MLLFSADEKVGKFISEAMEKKVTSDGLSLSKKSKPVETYSAKSLKVYSSMRLYHPLVTDSDKMKPFMMTLTCLSLIRKFPLGKFSTPRANRKTGKKLVIIAEDVEGRSSYPLLSSTL